MKVTLKEIIKAKTIRKGTEYEVLSIFEYINDLLDIDYDSKIPHIEMLMKVDKQYDTIRGARTEVLTYNNEPFLVVTRAGRALSDIFQYYILNKELMKKAEQDIIINNPYIESNFDKEIELAYWEGEEVKLGDE